MAESLPDNIANVAEAQQPGAPQSKAEAHGNDKQFDQTTPMPLTEPQQSGADSGDPIAQIDIYMRDIAVNIPFFTQ